MFVTLTFIHLAPFVAAFAKNEQADFTSAERNDVRRLIAKIEHQLRKKR